MGGKGEGVESVARHPFTSQLITGGLVLATVSGLHIEMARAGAIRFMGFAHKAASAAVLWAFTFMVHLGSP